MSDDVSESLKKALMELHEESAISTFVSRSATPSGDTGLPGLDLLFARFREDTPDVEALAEFLSGQIVNYVVPLRKRKAAVIAVSEAKGSADLSVIDRLNREAKRKFVELNDKYPGRASELGELLAYLIAQQWLGAFQLASKMALKTSFNMPVHGLDGIHAKFDNGVMTLYFLESKMAKTAKQGMREFSTSIKDFASNRKQYLLEYSIVSDLSNLDSLADKDRESALEYLDVYGKRKSKRLERSVGVVCYSEALFDNKLPKSDTTPPDEHEQHFAGIYRQEFNSLQSEFRRALNARGLSDDAGSMWLVAVPDKDLLRQLFYQGVKV